MTTNARYAWWIFNAIWRASSPVLSIALGIAMLWRARSMTGDEFFIHTALAFLLLDVAIVFLNITGEEIRVEHAALKSEVLH